MIGQSTLRLNLAEVDGDETADADGAGFRQPAPVVLLTPNPGNLCSG